MFFDEIQIIFKTKLAKRFTKPTHSIFEKTETYEKNSNDIEIDRMTTDKWRSERVWLFGWLVESRETFCDLCVWYYDGVKFINPKNRCDT